MGRREDGDKVVRALELDLELLVASDDVIEQKIDRIDCKFQEMATPWADTHDDRVVVNMIVTAASAIWDAVDIEIQFIKKDLYHTPEEKRIQFAVINRKLETIPWLGRANKTAIKRDLAFAQFATSGVV